MYYHAARFAAAPQHSACCDCSLAPRHLSKKDFNPETDGRSRRRLATREAESRSIARRSEDPCMFNEASSRRCQLGSPGRALQSARACESAQRTRERHSAQTGLLSQLALQRKGQDTQPNRAAAAGARRDVNCTLLALAGGIVFRPRTYRGHGSSLPADLQPVGRPR